MKQLLILLIFTLSSYSGEKLILEENGKSEPLTEGLNFHHEEWVFSNGVMQGTQKGKHLATIRGKAAFNNVRLSWSMKFLDPKSKFLYVTWAKGSKAHAMDFNLNPQTGDFAIIRPGSKNVKGARLAVGKASLNNDGWFHVSMEFKGKSLKVTINGKTIEAADDVFKKEMEYFYLNGGPVFQVKDIKLFSLEN